MLAAGLTTFGAGAAAARSAHAAGACPGKVQQRTAGGALSTEILHHGEGPETEEAFLCSSDGGMPFRIEGPLGSGFSLAVSVLLKVSRLRG